MPLKNPRSGRAWKLRQTIPTRSDLRGEGQLFQAMLAHWLHEDQLYWNQIRHLLVLQVAVFAAWFALGLNWLAVLVTAAAAVMCALIYRLALVIAQNRDSNLPAIQRISKNIASTETVSDISGDIFKFATHSLGGWTDRGRSFQSAIFWLCLAVNLTLAVSTAIDLSGYKTLLPALHWKFLSAKTSTP